jgi:hypothetical protein
VLIHGGGWKLVGRVMTGFMNPVAERLNQAGYETLNIDHGPGRASLPDALAFRTSHAWSRTRRRPSSTRSRAVPAA